MYPLVTSLRMAIIVSRRVVQDFGNVLLYPSDIVKNDHNRLA
jgi:hypothetical protein